MSVLVEFWDLFSHDGSYGHTHLLQHRIITEDVPPIKYRYRPVNPALEPDLRRQLDEWLCHDVIEPANSPWSFNLVAAKKKGRKIRWCIDWRRLNEITKKDTFPMPSVQDTISCLAGSRIYSGVDVAGAFHCIDIDPREREKTAFATPFGSFQQKLQNELQREQQNNGSSNGTWTMTGDWRIGGAKTSSNGNALWNAGQRNDNKKKNDGNRRNNGAKRNPGSWTRESGKDAAKGN